MASPRSPLVLVWQRGAACRAPTDGWPTLMGSELAASRMQSNWQSSTLTLFGGWKAFPCLSCPVPRKEEGCSLGAKLLFFCAATCPAHRAETAEMGLACRLQWCFLKQKKHNCSSLHLSRALGGCACSLSRNKAGNCLCSRLPRAAKPPQLCCLLCYGQSSVFCAPGPKGRGPPGAAERNEALPAAAVAASTLPILWQMGEQDLWGSLPAGLSGSPTGAPCHCLSLLCLGEGWPWPQVLESS